MNILSKLFLMLCRFAVAALFLFAAYQKLFAPDSGPQKFALAISSFKILPDHLVLLATGTIPWLEVICGILLVCGLWTRAAATVLALLLIGFTGAVISVLVRGLPVSCGCFGNLTLLCSKDVMTGCKVAENALILLPTLLVAYFGGGFLDFDRPVRRIRLDPPVAQPPSPSPTPSPSKA